MSITTPTPKSRGKGIAKGAGRRDEEVLPVIMQGVVVIAIGVFMGQALNGDTGDAAAESAVLTAALHLTMPVGSDFTDKALRGDCGVMTLFDQYGVHVLWTLLVSYHVT